MSKIFKIFILTTVTIFFISVANIHAVIPDGGSGNLPKSEAEQFGGFTYSGLIGQVITRILPIILTIAGFITVIVIIISGIQFVLSSGNPEAAAAAKNRLIYAIVGFIIIVLAFAILQIVNRIFLGNTGIV